MTTSVTTSCVLAAGNSGEMPQKPDQIAHNRIQAVSAGLSVLDSSVLVDRLGFIMGASRPFTALVDLEHEYTECNLHRGPVKVHCVGQTESPALAQYVQYECASGFLTIWVSVPSVPAFCFRVDSLAVNTGEIAQIPEDVRPLFDQALQTIESVMGIEPQN